MFGVLNNKIYKIMLKLCKFYRYFIYRIYHNNKNDVPVIRVLASLCIVHIFHFFNLMFLTSRIFCQKMIVPTKIELVIFAIFFLALHYVLFYNKEKWEEYFKEFENETNEERRKGTIKVMGYYIGNILIPILMMVVVSELFPQ